MSIPLLGTDYFRNDASQGMVTNFAATMMAQRGAELGKEIEKQALVADSRFKAPGITELYSGAYQKIVTGDMTGFADMQKARAMAMGNPILMSTVDDADKLAGHLANTWLSNNGAMDRTELSLTRTEKSQVAADKRASDTQASIDARQDKALRFSAITADNRSEQLQYRERYDSWEKEKFMLERQYDAQTKAWGEIERANAVKREHGIPVEPNPKPQAPVIPPAPRLTKINSLPSQGLPDEDALFDVVAGSYASTGAPAPDFAQNDTPELPEIGVPLPTQKATVPAQEVFGGAKIETKTTTTEEGKPLVNQIEAQIGSIIVKLKPKPPTPDQITTGADGKITTTYKFQKDAEEAAGIIHGFATDSNFANFISSSARNGKPVALIPKDIQKGKPSYYVAQAGNDVYSTKVKSLDPAKPGTREPVQFTEEQYKKWTRYNELLAGLDVEVEKPKIELSQSQIEAVDKGTRAAWAADPTNPQWNEARLDAGLEPLKPEPVKKSDPIVSALEKQGIVSPDKAKAKKEDEELMEKNAKRLGELPAHIANLKASLVNYKGKNLSPEEFAKAKAIQEKIDALQKEFDSLKTQPKIPDYSASGMGV